MTLVIVFINPWRESGAFTQPRLQSHMIHTDMAEGKTARGEALVQGDTARRVDPVPVVPGDSGAGWSETGRERHAGGHTKRTG